MKLKSLTCSAASEASASDLKQPELFGPLPSASKTNSAKPSCENTGLTHQSTTMSDNLKETRNPPLQMELTSSAAGSRNCASLGVKPGSSEAQRMTVISGRSWLPLLKSYGLDGSLGRMCEALLTSRWASDAAFLTWKASGIKPSHLLFQLAPSMPRTDATASGSSPRKMAPTPTASDHIERTSTSSEKVNPLTGKSVSLDRFVRFWPDAETQASGTPTMWPTPKARDWKDGASAGTQGRSSPDLGKVVGQSQTAGSLNPTWVEWLMDFPTGWTDLKPSETPSSRKSSRRSAKRSSRQSDDLS